MAVSTRASERPTGHNLQLATLARWLVLAFLACLLISSTWLSYWSSSLSQVYLPAADVWQHIALLTEAISGTISLDNLLAKHNHLHFIPVPKLVYALDIRFFSGSGQLTTGLSGLFTVACCLFVSICILETDSIGRQEKIALSLLTSSWLVSAIQWESFVNPANLQWSGLNAGLALIAAGWKKRPSWIAAGALLAIGCGAPWWILVTAVTALHIPLKRILVTTGLILLATSSWEIANLLWLQKLAPLPLFLLDLFTPLQPEQLSHYTTAFLTDPLGSYLEWGKNLLAFTTRFCIPPIDHWASTEWAILMSPMVFVAFYYPAKHWTTSSPFTFIAIVILMTSLAAGSVRAQLPGAYTLRFANAGLLFVSVFFVVSYVHYRQSKVDRLVWVTLAITYTAFLAIASVKEAANIVHDSNQRRLSQIAYALDIHDARATSETPFAPMMEVSYREIMARKGVLAAHEKGVYHSREYRIFDSKEPLPTREVYCEYTNPIIKLRKEDSTAYKITGKATDPDGNSMPSVLIRQNTQNIGYGIYQAEGATLQELMTQQHYWAGYFHGNALNKIELVAYDDQQRCQPLGIDLSTIQ